MKYVVTNEDVNRAIDAYERAPGVMQDKAMRAALESFAKTLGEPVSYEDPDGFDVAMCLAEANNWTRRETGKQMILNYAALLYAAPHHPTTEKGCE